MHEVSCFVQLLWQAFPILAIMKYLICQISNFLHLLYSIFFSVNAVMHCYLAPNTYEIQSRTRSAFSNSKRLLNLIAQKYTTYDLQGAHIKSKSSACL